MQENSKGSGGIYSSPRKLGDPSNSLAEAEIHAFFQHFGALAEKGDSALIDEFDFETILDAARSQGVAIDVEPEQLRNLINRMQENARANLADQFQDFGWGKVIVQAIQPLNNVDEFVVNLRHCDEHEIWSSARWWVKRRDGRWRIYDFEDLESNLRLSALLAISVASEDNDWQRALLSIAAATRQMMDEDISEAWKSLQEIKDVSLPPPIEATRRLLTASVYLAKEKPLESLREIELAEKMNPDMPALNLLRATVYQVMGEHEKCLEFVTKYESSLGPDSDTCMLRGDSLLALGRREEAKDVYRQGFEWIPESQEYLAFIARALGNEAGPVVVPLIQKSSDPYALFKSLCAQLWDERSIEPLESLVKELRSTQPENIYVAFFDSCLSQSSKDYVRAAETLEKAIQRVTDAEEKRTFVNEYRRNMVLARRAIEVYENDPDAKAAFKVMAGEMRAIDDMDSLRMLVDAHQKKCPDDPWASYYDAYLLGFHDDSAGAGQKLEGSMPLWPTDEEDRSRFMSLYLYSMLNAGLAVRAYEKSDNRFRAFEYLAERLLEERRHHGALRDLIATHAAVYPDDQWLDYYSGEAYRVAKDYERAEEAYRRGTRQRLEPGLRETYREARVNARYEAGKGLEAYQSISPKLATFHQLCRLFYDDDDLTGLRRLLDARRQDRGETLEVKMWEAEIAYAEGDYVLAAEKFAAIGPIELLDPDVTWRIADRMIRSLARMGKADEAQQWIDAQEDEIYSDVWQAIVFAHTGRGAEAVARLEAALESENWEPLEFYADEDLHGFLYSSDSTEFRKKYIAPNIRERQ